MMQSEIQKVLIQLSQERPIFDSEKDFQFAFAWTAKSLYPDIKVRLEKPMDKSTKRREHIDIWLEDGATKIGIEMKYITSKFSTSFNGELFKLQTHAAQDLRCYDILKDIMRLEKYIEKGCISVGYSIVLTNDDILWKSKENGKESYYDNFRVNDGRVLNGVLDWKPGASEGTRKGRKTPIDLTGHYQLTWDNYSTIEPAGINKSPSKNLFKYLINEVNPNVESNEN